MLNLNDQLMDFFENKKTKRTLFLKLREFKISIF